VTAGIDGERLDAGLDEALRRDLVTMTCDMVAIASPTGEEGALADYVRDRFADLGLRTELQAVEPGRHNVVARCRSGCARSHASSTTSGSTAWACRT
jgi:acetylornithine deacetylase/succinyl-diaminopimelate desuccinylase-like protein